METFSLMRLAQIWRYPVKSMIGEQVSSIEVAEHGFVGDRHWAVRDEVRGGIRGAKKFGGLMRLRAEAAANGETHVHFPDGTNLIAGDPSLDARLSLELAHEVTLQSLPAATDLDHFRRGEPDSEDLLTDCGRSSVAKMTNHFLTCPCSPRRSWSSNPLRGPTTMRSRFCS